MRKFLTENYIFLDFYTSRQPNQKLWASSSHLHLFTQTQLLLLAFFSQEHIKLHILMPHSQVLFGGRSSRQLLSGIQIQLYFCKHQWLVTGTFTSNGNTHNILINHILLTAKTKAHSTPLHTNLQNFLKYPPISQQLTFFCLVALSGQITKLYFPFQLFHHNYPILI